MPKSKLRTIVYIDGSIFTMGNYKTVLGEESELVKIKYFTARVRPTERDPQVKRLGRYKR